MLDLSNKFHSRFSTASHLILTAGISCTTSITDCLRKQPTLGLALLACSACQGLILSVLTAATSCTCRYSLWITTTNSETRQTLWIDMQEIQVWTIQHIIENSYRRRRESKCQNQRAETSLNLWQSTAVCRGGRRTFCLYRSGTCTALFS